MSDSAPQRPDAAPSGPGEVLLETHALRLGYGRRTVLEQVELRLCRGEFWFLIGPNGHGKTTLLAGLLGQLRPQAGQLLRLGDFARPQRMGFVPQQCGANRSLPTTVREFVGLGLVGIAASRAQQRQRLAWALQTIGLDGLERRDLWSLSAGQRQRALVARALVRRPSVLVADEPASGLDLSVETALYEALAELNRREDLTVLLVAHDLAVAARYATHLALVHDGRVEAGTAQEILRPEKLRQAYGVPIAVEHAAQGPVNVRLG